MSNESKPSKPKKIKSPKTKAETKSEAQLVQEYARNIIHRQVTRGHGERMMQTNQTTNKDLWLDTDFFFSVVFQSSRQKMEFFAGLAKAYGGVTIEAKDEVQIVNGMELAKVLGIKLTPETAVKEFPQGDLALRPFVLDDEVK